MPPLRDLFDGQISRVVERRRAFGVDEHQVADNLLARSREILHQLGAVVEADQEEIVVVVRGLHEAAQRLDRPHDALFHRPRNVVDDADRNRRVFVGEVRDILLHLVVKQIEVIFCKAGHKTPIGVGDADQDVDDAGVQLNGLAVGLRRPGLQFNGFRRGFVIG